MFEEIYSRIGEKEMTKYEQAERLYSCVGIQEAGNYDTLLNVCTLLFKAYKELEAENKELKNTMGYEGE